MKKTFLSVLLAFAVPTLALAAPKVGAPAPEFQLTNQNGDAVNLADYRGKTVVLEWTNHECPFVRKHYESGNMQALQKRHTDDGVVWLSVVSSAPGKQGYLTAKQAAGMSDKQGAHRTHLLMDSDGSVGKQYAAKTTPHMYVVDEQGVLQYMGAIDSNPSASQDVIKSSTNYIDVVVPELMAGKTLSYTTTKPYGCSVKY